MPDTENIADIARRIAGTALSALAESDPRADGGRREIHCARERLVIRRSVAGIAMQLEIPVRAYKGVALSAAVNREGVPVYRLSLAHSDPALAIVLYEARNDRDVIAVWKGWANYFALARLVQRKEGEFEACETLYGATVAGEQPLWRRRGGALAARKPTQRSRRRNAHAILKPFVERNNAPAIAEL